MITISKQADYSNYFMPPQLTDTLPPFTDNLPQQTFLLLTCV
jgi:hypothetical protein